MSFREEQCYLQCQMVYKLIIGEVKGCDWAPSACILDASAYNLDSICAKPCQAGSCKTDISLNVAWTGTDGSGAPLTSYGRDTYRLQNSFS